MWFLFFQIWLWLLIAFIAGWFAHWFLCCRGKEPAKENKTARKTASLTLEPSESNHDPGSTAEESLPVDEAGTPRS
jgi:hypothetical protein